MVETVLGWFLAGCVAAVVIAFFIAITLIAFSFIPATAFLIMDWLEKRKRKKLPQDLEKNLPKECSRVHPKR